MKPTPPQKRVLNDLVRHGGKAEPYYLGYPRTPMLRRMSDAGWIKPGTAPAFDIWNSVISITNAGRATLTDGQSDGAK